MITDTLTRRGLLILLGLTLTRAAVAQSTSVAKEKADDTDGRDDGDEDELDQDIARRALIEGKARPLSEIMAKVEGNLGGHIIEVEFDREGDRFMYDFTVLQSSGRILEFEVDALTGEILTIEEE